MSIALSLVALSFLAGEPEAASTKEFVGFSVKTFDAPSIEWREACGTTLRSVTRQGGVQVWTASRANAAAIAKPATQAISAPKVMVSFGSAATIDSHTTRFFVTNLVADRGSVKPQTEEFRDGYSAILSARDATDGIVTNLVLESNWIGDVRDIHVNAEGTRGATVQMPQVLASKVNCELLLPESQVLVVSLGQQSVGGKDAKLMERFVMIEANRVADSDKSVQTTAFNSTFKADPGSGRPMPVLAIRPMPKLPSRSLLTATDPNGKDLALPPLPDAELTKTSFDSSGSPRATPQSPFVPMTNAAPRLKVDTQVAPAHFEPAPPIPTVPAQLDGAELASGRTQTIRLPLGGRLSIELKAKIVPSEKPE
jgi:hypothetical protein